MKYEDHNSLNLFLFAQDPRWLDVHVVASLIKSFLRRLPDPLLTNDRYPAFIQAADEDEKTSLARIKELINSLPVHYYETLKTVVMHLKHVAEKGEANRMDARNLAIVFGPTIVRTAGESINSMVVDMKNQCKIVEALVLHVSLLQYLEKSDIIYLIKSTHFSCCFRRKRYLVRNPPGQDWSPFQSYVKFRKSNKSLISSLM